MDGTHRVKVSTRGGRWRGESEPITLAELAETADLLADGVQAALHVMGDLNPYYEWVGGSDRALTDIVPLPEPNREHVGP